MKAIVFCLKCNNIPIKYHFIINVSGEVAKNCSYLAKGLELKKVDNFGISSSVVEKARKNLNAYSFLFWIDKYQKPRRIKSNVKAIKLEMPADEEENSEVTKNTPSFQEFDDQPFDEEKIPDATQKQESTLQSENSKKSLTSHP